METSVKEIFHENNKNDLRIINVMFDWNVE